MVTGILPPWTSPLFAQTWTLPSYEFRVLCIQFHFPHYYPHNALRYNGNILYRIYADDIEGMGEGLTYQTCVEEVSDIFSKIKTIIICCTNLLSKKEYLIYDFKIKLLSQRAEIKILPKLFGINGLCAHYLWKNFSSSVVIIYYNICQD